MKYNILETVVGFLIIGIACAFLVFSYGVSQKSAGRGGYSLFANFQNVDGIVTGSDVMLAGIKIGVVESLELDQNTFVAKVTLKINPNVSVPKDSQASVTTSGLLGGKFIEITPGSDDVDLKAGEQIKRTQSSVSLENLIGKMMYSK